MSTVPTTSGATKNRRQRQYRGVRGRLPGPCLCRPRPLTKKLIYLTKVEREYAEAERTRTKLLAQVDARRAPKSNLTVN